MGPSVDIALVGFNLAERVTADNSQGLAHRRWGGHLPWDNPGGLNGDRVSMARAGPVAVSTLTLLDCVLRPARSVKSSQSLMPVNYKKGLHSLRQSAGDCNEDGRMDYLGYLHRASQSFCQAQCEVDGRLFLFWCLE